MDHHTQARILLYYVENGLSLKFSELLAEHGSSVDCIPANIFKEISENCNCSEEEIIKLFQAYVEFEKDKNSS